MKPYRELTRRSRLYRLRNLAKVALEVYGLPEARLSFIQYLANIIYRVDVPGVAATLEDNSPYVPGRYLLRIHGMDDSAAIASEMVWLTALNQEAGLPVPAPLPMPGGELLARIATPGIPNGRIVSVMRWVDGQRLERGLRPKHLMALGQVVAQMHTFSANWQPPADFERPHWDWDTQLGGMAFDHTLDELVASMPAHARQPFLTVSQEAKQAMDALGKGSDAYGLIHADLYPENVLYKAGKACPIDFEDCGFGYWMWDIAVALCKWAWEQDWERMRDAFYEGYSRVRILPAAQWAQLDLFLATQFATMVLWSSAFIMDDPMRAAEHEPWREDSIHKLLQYFEGEGPIRRRMSYEHLNENAT